MIEYDLPGVIKDRHYTSVTERRLEHILQGVEKKWYGNLRTKLVNPEDPDAPVTTCAHEFAAALIMAIVCQDFEDKSQLLDLVMGALLHDTGKFDSTLVSVHRYVGELSPNEKVLINTHPIKSTSKTPRASKNIQNMAEHHHERYDGSGYPYGFSDEAIPHSAGIMGIIDILESATSNRNYNGEALTFDTAMELLEQLFE